VSKILKFQNDFCRPQLDFSCQLTNPHNLVDCNDQDLTQTTLFQFFSTLFEPAFLLEGKRMHICSTSAAGMVGSGMYVSELQSSKKTVKTDDHTEICQFFFE
jgi:hypothetical protein